MANSIYNFFVRDHRRLDALMEQACAQPQIDLDLYHEFRVGLLTHIKMEEKILFLAAQKANHGHPLPLQAQLRLEHGAISALLVCYPTIELVRVLRYVLHHHDELEEREGGMYQACERLTHVEKDDIILALNRTTPVPVQPYNTASYVLDVAKRTLQRAGFNYDQILATTT